METTEGEDNEDGGGCRVKRTQQAHSRSDLSQAPWSIMLRKAELKRRDSKETRNFRRHFSIPYECFLELVQLTKHQKWFSLAARDVAGRQCTNIANSAKNAMWYKYVGWIRDESKYRLYYK